MGGDWSGALTGVPAKSCVLLAKAPPQEARAVGIVPGAHAPPARPLHLEHPESPLAALYEHEIIQYGDDRAWFVSFRLQLKHVRGMMQCCVWILGMPVEDAKRIPVEDGFGHRPGIERPDLAFDVGRTTPPVDPGLGLHDLGGMSDPSRWLGGSLQRPRLESLERLEERCGAESGELSPKQPRAVPPRDGHAALEQHRAGGAARCARPVALLRPRHRGRSACVSAPRTRCRSSSASRAASANSGVPAKATRNVSTRGARRRGPRPSQSRPWRAPCAPSRASCECARA